VIFITDARSEMDQAEGAMKNDNAPYKIFRVLRDGEELFVAGRPGLMEAKECVAKFIDCWPGQYLIHGPGSFTLVCRTTWQ
jgi:hypothetical protein